jgi:hypothetical protein
MSKKKRKPAGSLGEVISWAALNGTDVVATCSFQLSAQSTHEQPPVRQSCHTRRETAVLPPPVSDLDARPTLRGTSPGRQGRSSLVLPASCQVRSALGVTNLMLRHDMVIKQHRVFSSCLGRNTIRRVVSAARNRTRHGRQPVSDF